MNASNAEFSVEGFEQRLMECFDEYGSQWGTRVAYNGW